MHEAEGNLDSNARKSTNKNVCIGGPRGVIGAWNVNLVSVLSATSAMYGRDDRLQKDL